MLDRRILLEPGEEAVQRVHGDETHFESGALYQTLGAPTCRPAVSVETPPGLEADVWFANRGRSEAFAIGGRYVLPNVLLPFQPIVVRWWPQQQRAEWQQRHTDRLTRRAN